MLNFIAFRNFGPPPPKLHYLQTNDWSSNIYVLLESPNQYLFNEHLTIFQSAVVTEIIDVQ